MRINDRLSYIIADTGPTGTKSDCDLSWCYEAYATHFFNKLLTLLGTVDTTI